LRKGGRALSGKIVIIGAGGLSLQMLDILEACNHAGTQYKIFGYIVESIWGKPGVELNGFPVLGDFDWFDTCKEEVFAITAVAAPEVRFHLVKKAKEKGIRFCNIIHPDTILTRQMSIGEDVVVHAGCILSYQNRIGSHVIVNMDCTIGEKTRIEDFVTLSPGVNVSGDVTIGMGAYIGTGADIIEKVHIGEWSVIGAGSTIIRDVPPNTTVVGVPGKVIKTREAGWHRTRRTDGSGPP
jgi:sugar O-acyltransferase (sialic acid O-acetyltransferase NeuD family)